MDFIPKIQADKIERGELAIADRENEYEEKSKISFRDFCNSFIARGYFSIIIVFRPFSIDRYTRSKKIIFYCFHGTFTESFLWYIDNP